MCNTKLEITNFVFSEAMINTFNTIKKLRRIGYSILKEAGMIGWKEHLKAIQLPFPVPGKTSE